MTDLPPLGRVRVRTASASPRRAEPVTVGVPLPRGRVRDAATLVLTASEPLPTQAVALDWWSDGSIRWALVETRVNVPVGGAELLVRDDVPVPPIAQPLAMTLTPRRASVTSGGTRIEVDLDRGQPFAAVVAGGLPVFDAARAAVLIRDAAGGPMPLRYTAVSAEVSGPLRIVLRIDGAATGANGVLVDACLRLTVLAGLPVMGVELALRNPNAAVHPGGFWELGDPGSALLGEVTVLFPLPGAARSCRASLEPGAPLQSVALPFAVTQHSSGGEHWASAAHVNRDGVVTLERQGYTTQAGGVEGAGPRATPVVVAEHAAGALWVTADRFWEVFPKAIEVAADGVVRVGCLPPGRDLHELQGGERCDFA
ncbi:MAG TPA: hypothetical protein VMW48_09425, partial [Vicinamibacterales bacterium]|nr:hypothetical protein [Vicinamibacterales bacterium]